MYIHHKLGIPVVFDHAHYSYKPIKGVNQREALKMAMSTWKNQVPKVHLCSQAPGVKIHNHADYIDAKDYLKLKQDL
jgi:UV DNA damage repair endonuclease